MGSRMKTTIEIGDDLLQRTKRVLRKQGGTLRSLVEEGLTLALERREKKTRPKIKPVTFGGNGLQPEFQNAPWEKIRDEIYRDGRG